MTEPSKVIHVRNVGHEISEVGFITAFLLLGVSTFQVDLLQLLQPFGEVTKIVMLRAKNQALLQMWDTSSAANAMQFYSLVQPSVRGRNVYMQFSSYQELTTPDQGSQGRKDQDFRPSSNFSRAQQLFDLKELQVNYNNERSRDFTNPSLPSEQRGRSAQSGYGEAIGICALHPAASRAVAFAQMSNAAAIAAAFGGGLPPGICGTNDRCTIIASNLNTDKIDEDKLFNLFSLYGNIVRIKFLPDKPDHALIEMEDWFQAELAVHFLKGALLFGKRLEVNYSKYSNITPAPDTREYSGSSLNRFNRNAAKNYRHCCAPTKMIHISTLPHDITEDDLVSHLGEHGTIENTKIFEAGGKKQALVLFECEEEATRALVCEHASEIDGYTIHIFSLSYRAYRSNLYNCFGERSDCSF